MAWPDLSRLEQLLDTRYVGRRLVYYSSVGSTQDIARREAEAGAPEGTLVLADEQTAGRGRLGRSWASPPGQNLYLTLVLRPPLEVLKRLTIVAPLAVARAVADTTGIQAGIKWPNDVWIGRRKLAGVLLESEVQGGQVRYCLLGIGINVNMDVEAIPDLAEIATSLRRELGREVPREDVLASLLHHLEALYEEARGGGPVLEEWRARLITLGQEVTVRFGDQVEEGLAEDVDEEGRLLLRRRDGSRIAIEAGDVTLRGS
ncbi:Bifunctional ligase/repressor BirA [bacterium HR24]|nr:Bifunctional ligase/repressor BirA [bacterium HR24]